MNKLLVREFVDKIKTLSDEEYILAVIAYNIAPILAKHKPAGIITFSRCCRELDIIWKRYRQNIMSRFEIHFYEFLSESDSITVFFYDEELLYEIIFDIENKNYLETIGYEYNTIDELLTLMKQSYTKHCPHEIGIMLGFPLEDVVQFTKDPYGSAVISGYWKAYSNADKALETFRKYDRDREFVIHRILNGMNYASEKI